MFRIASTRLSKGFSFGYSRCPDWGCLGARTLGSCVETPRGFGPILRGSSITQQLTAATLHSQPNPSLPQQTSAPLFARRTHAFLTSYTDLYAASEPFQRHNVRGFIRPPEPPREATAVHTFRCRDQLGVVAQIGNLIAGKGGNLISVDLHIDIHEPTHPEFMSRAVFTFDPVHWTRDTMDHDFASMAEQFAASHWKLKLEGDAARPRMGILVSKQEHCLMDLLHHWQDGTLPVDIACVVSNHARGTGNNVREILNKCEIPYYHLPTSTADRPTSDTPREQERAALDIVRSTDFLVLARYMQVLSGPFLAQYGRDVINIHHGLLPSFKGARPYKQAHDAGVKIIGATSHFVTEELDEGPIIEQLVERVSHRHSLANFAAISQNLEKQCLTNAVQLYLDDRLVRYSLNRVAVLN